MIYLKQQLDLYDNDIRVMLQAFFDNEKVVRTKAGSRLSLVVDYACKEDEETGAKSEGVVTFSLADDKGYESVEKEEADYWDKKASKNRIKAALYRQLSAYTGKTLPWGTLTGVRPTKIATELLENGVAEEAIHREYTDTYLTIPQKADICIEVAKREQQLFKDFQYEEEYCVYIGIPFCPSRCLYCSFTSYPIAAYEDKAGDYLKALYREMDFVAQAYRNKRLVSIYVGGGTPSVLSASQLEELIGHIRQAFSLRYLREFCVECGRPDSLTEEKLRALKKSGVQRISINPQTMSDDTLRLIGRAHTARQTKDAFAMARQAGFDNINMDIIAGLPGEGMEELLHTLSEIRELKPDSLTVHSLAIKRAANLNREWEQYRKLVFGSTNEMLTAVDRCARESGLFPYYLYRQKNIPGKLENIGYAAEGKECVYNILIMEEKLDILAMGAGAASKFIFREENRIERAENVKNVDEYIARVDEMMERKQKLFSRKGGVV